MSSSWSYQWFIGEGVNGPVMDNTAKGSMNEDGGKVPIKYDLQLGLSLNNSVESFSHSEVTHNNMQETGKFGDCMYGERSLSFKHGSGSESQNGSSSSVVDGNVCSVSCGHEFLDTVHYSIPGSTSKPNCASQGVSFTSSNDSLGMYTQPRSMANIFSDDSDSVSAILCTDVCINSPGGPGIMTDEGSTNAAKRTKLKDCGSYGLLDTGFRIDRIHYTYPATAHPEGSTKAGNPSSNKSHCVSLICEPSTASQLLMSGNRSKKMCKFPGCSKGSRGASGLCITHGGGRRCQKPDCTRGAESRTNFCKTHGGGPRCQILGCLKSAEGKTEYCIAHGGGNRCSFVGCTKAARGRSGKCIKHGGGKRCQKEGCTRSAEGLSGMCISHGGGRRCQFPGCGKGAQGSTMFCKGHGGGKRCVHEGCTKGAEGSTMLCKAHGGGKRCTFGDGVCTKSVHGGTLFCVAHGGGKRCCFPGCTKSARGRTDCCVRHGGGKRCKAENCSKSAQGSTDFCKAHGGGKKCIAHCRTMQQQLLTNAASSSSSHNPMVISTSDDSRHSAETAGKETQVGRGHKMAVTTMSDVSAVHSESTVAVPHLIGSSQMFCPENSSRLLLPSLERRVHGGSLMALLAKGAASSPMHPSAFDFRAL